MMKMAPSMIAIAMAALGATAAHAADDIYFGAGVGATHFNGLNKLENTNVGQEDAAAANAFMGYNFTENFNAYVDYKVNLLDSVADSTSKLGQNTDDVVGVALQYNF